MIFVERLEEPTVSPDTAEFANASTLSLPFERRQIARQRVTLDNGSEAGLKLPRGTILREGDVLRSVDHNYIRISAAPERVSKVECSDAQGLARAAYHLGNRHVWVQVGTDWLCYLHDHVLDTMLVGLGLTVSSELAPFEPEAGAYSESGSHSHGEHHHSH